MLIELHKMFTIEKSPDTIHTIKARFTEPVYLSTPTNELNVWHELCKCHF